MDLATLLSLLSLLVSAFSLIVAISVSRQTSILRRDDERFRWTLQMQKAILAHTKLQLVLDRAVRLDADIERFVNQADFEPVGGELAGAARELVVAVRKCGDDAREKHAHLQRVLDTAWSSQDTSAKALSVIQQVETSCEHWGAVLERSETEGRSSFRRLQDKLRSGDGSPM